jgi:hypothetical protein
MTTFRKDAQNKVDRMTDDQFRLVATTKDESGEVMADYFGAKVLGDYIKINKINPNQEPHDNLKPLGLFITNYCKNNNKLKTQDSFSTEFKILSTHMNDGHPAEKKRIEYLLLSNPNIASYVGCEPIAPNLCR